MYESAPMRALTDESGYFSDRSVVRSYCTLRIYAVCRFPVASCHLNLVACRCKYDRESDVRGRGPDTARPTAVHHCAARDTTENYTA